MTTPPPPSSEIDWTRLPVPIRCPKCGNNGTNPELWETNAPVPFRIVERILHTWPIARLVFRGEDVVIVCEGGTDTPDYESGDEPLVECCSCYEQFALPDPFIIEWT